MGYKETFPGGEFENKFTDESLLVWKIIHNLQK